MANEFSALADVGADAIDRFAITPAEMLHSGIARRVFANVGVGAVPTRVVHDRVAASAYALTRRAVSGAGAAVAAGLRRAGGDADVRPLSRSRRGRLVIGVINGFAGDRLAERGNDLSIRMSVRARGRDVACSAPALARAFPDATPRLAVFLHGLAETEEWWLRSGRPHRVAQLRGDTGFMPVYLRYNTGLHVSENGAQLAALLELLLASWPVEVEHAALIGHSMGGLVVRSASHAATELGHAWPARVRHVVTLGTPHHGAPLSKAVHAAAWALRRLPETTPLAHVLDTRSAGIRDLRFGSLHADDWGAEHPGDFADRRRHIPLLPGCRYTFITASVTVDPHHPLGWLLGDLLVRTESAGGRCKERVIPIDADSVVHLGGLNHFDLLDHPLAYGVLRDVLHQPRLPRA